VLHSNPPGVFDQAALEAIVQWRYQPRLEGGRPVESPNVHAHLAFSDNR
jgi:outer membrane biosynthesis protein TonB